MGSLILSFFLIGFIAILIGALIEVFELYPTLSKYKGVKVKAAYLLKTRKKYWDEYYFICKERNKSLIFFNYIRYFDKWGMNYLIIFICIILLQILFIII